ncbi:lycopene cyclase family protein [Hoyosella subflava]|uniref:Lycopene beta-cyclase n=1 Tax=Hoyosella subflava (strain DSM 45089 / JCM 17490 / NBRC 109087 / DQS3-9A1) TaxID=443218 RepID=F6EN87_HOYSD|nr:lycopene cyclase family protein [Hoyosella subflava]AEF40358.1 Lycopene beta-cyclase [Hoyosella subflava DQS3-9A1]
MTAASGDVVVAGLGPAGRSLAHRCIERGLRVIAVDTHPNRTWTPTYGAWADELPPWLSPGAIAAIAHQPHAFGTQEWRIDRDYVVFDTAALQQSLTLTGSTVIQEIVTHVRPGVVQLADGTHLYGRIIVDARGLRAARHPQQTAFGVTVPASEAEPVLAGRSAWFMDWRASPASSGPPSFLYAIPLGKGRVLLEETCLAGQPPIPFAELEARLDARLLAHGVRRGGHEPVERVRFAVHAPRHTQRGVTSIGARGGILHPASGYSVAASLSLADPLADAIAFRSDLSAVLWPIRARVVSELRGRGLASFLRLPADDVPEFFDQFFALPVQLQRAYLSGRTDVSGLVMAMTRIFRGLAHRKRTHLIRGVVRPRL